MEIEELLVPKRRLEIRVEGDKKAYPTSIEGVDQRSFTVGQPLGGGKALLLQPGQEVDVKAFAAGDQFFFRSRILKRLMDPLPFYVLSFPQSIERIQLRDYVRFQVTLDFFYRMIPVEEEYEQATQLPFSSRGITIDLSGGGMQAFIREKLESGTLLAIRLDLRIKGKIAQLIQMAEVVRCQEAEAKNSRLGYKAALQFQAITEKERDLIVAFIFEGMRRLIHRKR